MPGTHRFSLSVPFHRCLLTQPSPHQIPRDVPPPEAICSMLSLSAELVRGCLAELRSAVHPASPLQLKPA